MRIKAAVVLFFAVIFLSAGTRGFADDPTAKFGRGITNILTAPGELYRQPRVMGETYDPVTSFFGGLLRGILFMAVREIGGVYETATFLIPIPRHYQPVMNSSTLFD